MASPRFAALFPPGSDKRRRFRRLGEYSWQFSNLSNVQEVVWFVIERNQ
jgi:hypothetical protein